jgi:hypothetical protein
LLRSDNPFGQQLSRLFEFIVVYLDQQCLAQDLINYMRTSESKQLAPRRAFVTWPPEQHEPPHTPSNLIRVREPVALEHQAEAALRAMRLQQLLYRI